MKHFRVSSMGWGYGSVVEHLSSRCQGLDSILTLHQKNKTQNLRVRKSFSRPLKWTSF
jgi:hypothetical protein